MTAATDDTAARFEGDIATHQVVILRDDGVYRHIRFKRPTTMCMHFDLVTWPGYLCYSGDMGCFVFARLDDMFEFHRRPPGKLSIDYRYWAEKLQASNKNGGHEEFSEELFRAALASDLDDYCEGMEPGAAQALRDEVAREVLPNLEDGHYSAVQAAMGFSHNGRHPFCDFWDHRLMDHQHGFVWACHAIAWGIAAYDAAKDAAKEGAPA